MIPAFHRLRRMSRDELAWRAGAAARTAAQRVAVRLRAPQWERRDIQEALADGAVDPAMRRAIAAADWPAVHDALAHALRIRAPRFVLDPASEHELRTEIRARWPGAAADAARRADRILAGRYDLLGYRDIDCTTAGAEDWHRDAVHGRCAPRAFWADVAYLDPALGDHKIIWELNRHQHWLQLGRALWLTGDPRYARGIVDRLERWLAANPPLTGINWASMLEIGFRAISWTWALHFLLADAAAEDAARGGAAPRPWIVDMLVGLDRQLSHVEQNLSHYFSPNTHLTGEALALYVVGLALPELAASGRRVEIGRRILIAEIDRQVLGDGGHAERSTHYHRYTLDFYLLALLAATRARDRSAAAIFAAAVERLAGFARVMADDRGRLPLIGDDDGGMVWPLAGRECHDVRDSLAAAALALGRPELAPWGVPEEVFWMAGRSAIERAPLVTTAPADSARPGSRVLPETGYYVARDGCGGHAVFDAGPHGYLNGGHAHADALAITLTLANRPLLVDAGTATYTVNPRLRDRMRTSASHNTITLDERPQSVPDGPFHWRTRADGRLHAWRSNAAFDWVEGSHDGYAPVRHRRTLLRAAGSGWLIVDEIDGAGFHEAAASWHFDPAWMLRCDAPGRLRATHLEGATAWLLHDRGDVSLVHGDEASGLGWYAPAYGALVPTWTARVTRRGAAGLTMVTWVGGGLPGCTSPPTLQRLAATCEGGGPACAARVTADGRSAVFLLRPGQPATPEARSCAVLDYQTNARVLHYTTDAERILALDLADASDALALREGWFSVAASEPMADLHVAVDHGVLDLRSSDPPPQLCIEGSALQHLTAIRLNGRMLQRPLGDRADALTVHGGHWGSAPHGRPPRADQAAPSHSDPDPARQLA